MASLFLEFPLRIMPRITHFGFRDLPTIREAAPHRHFGYEFVYFVDGRAMVRLLPHDTKTRVEHGDLLVVPPGAYHCFEAAESEFTYFWLGLQTSARIAVSHTSNWPSPLWDHGPDTPPPVEFAPNDGDAQLGFLDDVLDPRKLGILHGIPEVLPIFVRLRDEICRKRPLSRPYLSAKLMQLVVAIARNAKRYTPPQAMSEIERAAVYLEANLYRKLSLTDLLDQTNLSLRDIYRGFRELFGSTPMQYLHELRIEEAKRLLRCGRNLESVSQACGFSSAAHLCRAFRNAVGHTPRQYAREPRWRSLSSPPSPEVRS